MISHNLRKLPCDNDSYHDGSQHKQHSCNDSTHTDVSNSLKVWGKGYITFFTPVISVFLPNTQLAIHVKGEPVTHMSYVFVHAYWDDGCL